MRDRIAEEKINEIRQAVDIVDVISDYVSLKKQGRNYMGLCPFHGENTPSFSVSPEKQIFHCFGCGVGGNVFSFLMELENMPFQEAALKLAEKGNVQLELSTATATSQPSVSKDTLKMIEAHELLRKFYHHLLVNTKDGQHALEYLLERGFTMDSIVKFQIGYSLNSWDFVHKFLTKRQFDEELIEKAGLIIQREKDGSYFDRFRDRIMFPIYDHKGNTIAFSGRALGTDEPKYLNSPETTIFNKSKVLYNFSLARPHIRKLQQVTLFEGFADTIAADRAGVENGVATMGTSLTTEHVALITRNTNTATICYDSDHAGIEATYRAGTMLSDANCQVRVAQLPDGFDPDDYIKKYGTEKFSKDVIGGSIPFMSFKLLYLRRGKDLQNEGDRLQYIEEVLKEISMLDKAVERDHYLRGIANEFSLSLEALKEQQKAIYFANRKKQPGFEPKPMIPVKVLQSLKPAYHNAERSLIYYMMRDANIAYKVQDMLEGHPFNIDEHQAIVTYLYGYYEEDREPSPIDFMNFIPDEKLKRTVADIEMMSMKEEASGQEITDYIQQVLKHQKMLNIKEKEKERIEAERMSDIATAAKIAMEIIQLRKSL